MSAKTAPSLLQIYLFGHLRALTNGERLKLNCLPRTLPLWAYLLLNRKDPIPRDSLAYAFWPDVLENEARANLRRHLYDLRRILPPERPGTPWLLTENKVVQWNPASTYWLDVSEFEQLSASGSQPERLVEAVQLYGGELLQGVYDDWVFIERERLRNLLLGDLERLVLHSRARRDYPQAIAYAQKYLLNDPLSEDAVRWLVALRCESGDRPGALQEYHRFELQLKAELGIPPMPETEALFRALRSGRDTPQLQAALGSVFGSTAPVAPLPQAGGARLPEHNLPAQLTSFVGRQNETALIANLLGRSASPARLLTISGPGGSGKTRLALEAARHLLAQHAEIFPEGIWFVDLAPLSQPQHVLAAIAAVLNVRADGKTPLIESLKAVLRPRRLLLVLDNFEQVVEAAPQVTELLAAAPGLRVLVTSRILLEVYGESELPVPPLPLPEGAAPPIERLDSYPATALFVERARLANPAFQLNQETAAAIVAICRALDGLPLAIELAAVRSRDFSPAEMLAQLKDRLSFIASRLRDLPLRQRSLRGAIEWSYRLLPPLEQAIFAHLGVFAGSFSLEAAQAVCSDLCPSACPNKPPEATDAGAEAGTEKHLNVLLAVLARLVEHNMLRQSPNPGPQGETRFHLLLTLREYALECLEGGGTTEQIHQLHADYYLRLAAEAAPALSGPQQLTWLRLLENDLENLRAAFDCLLQQGEQIAALRLSAGLARFWEMTGSLAEGRAWLETALKTGAAASQLEYANGLLAASSLAWWQGDFEDTQQHLQQALEIYETLGEKAGIAACLRRMASLQDDINAPVKSQEILNRSLALYTQLGDAAGMASAYDSLAKSAYFRSDFSAARQFYEHSLELLRPLGDSWGLSRLLNNLGVLLTSQEDWPAARAVISESLEIRRQFGFKLGIAQSLGNLAVVLVQLQDYAAARRCALESLELRWELGVKLGATECLEILGQISAIERRSELAVLLLSAAERQRSLMNSQCDEFQTRQVEAARKLARTRLGSRDFQTAWEKGQGLNLETAVELARG